MASQVAPETWAAFIDMNEKVLKCKTLSKTFERCTEVYNELLSEVGIKTS